MKAKIVSYGGINTMVQQTIKDFIQKVSEVDRVVHIEVRPNIPFAYAIQDDSDKQFEMNEDMELN